jgi:hypothetical protein
VGDVVAAFGDIGIEHLFGFLLDTAENGFDGIMG